MKLKIGKIKVVFRNLYIEKFEKKTKFILFSNCFNSIMCRYKGRQQLHPNSCLIDNQQKIDTHNLEKFT